MSKTKISEYSATANSNTDVASINIDEGCAPSGINNAIRAVMGHLKDFQAGTAGDSFNGPVGSTTPAAGAFTTLSASSTLGVTGTATFSGAVVANGNTTIGSADTDTITQAASYVTGTQLKSAKTATNTLNLAAYDVDGAVYTNLVTLTASNTPTLGLTSTGVGTINNMSIGATTASTGAFTTLLATGNVTLGNAAADTVTVNGTTNFVAAPTIGGVGLGMGFRNRILNGAMVIDQRNAGASVTPGDGQFLVDRWIARVSQSSKYSSQQNAGSVTPPVGFKNYLGATSLSNYSVLATDNFAFEQRIEGLNVYDLSWGTANAKPITLSFQVYSSLTGTFGGSVLNGAANRSYPFSYVISAANTWTTISINIAGDTSGTWLTTNGTGLSIWFGLGVGSTYSGTAGSWAGTTYLSATGATSVVGTSGATFYITGVQLEKGSTATSFDYRPYGTELALCQRYFYKLNGYTLGYTTSASIAPALVVYPVTMRSAPAIDAGGTFTAQSGSNGTLSYTIITNQNAHLYNSAGNWSVNVYVLATAGFSAEL